MLPIIVQQSAQLVKFIAALGLTLKPAALQHVTNIANELVVASERRKKTLSALNRQQVELPADAYAVADCFRHSPWQAADVCQAVLVFLVKFTLELARRLKLDHLIWISFDDSWLHSVHRQLATVSAREDGAADQQRTSACRASAVHEQNGLGAADLTVSMGSQSPMFTGTSGDAYDKHRQNWLDLLRLRTKPIDRSQGGVDEYSESVTGVYNSSGEAGLRELPGVGQSIAGEMAGWLQESPT